MATRRYVEAPLTIEFSLLSENPEEFEREYQTLALNNDDAVGQWLKKAKARGETAESDPVLLQLLIELHRKIDSLEAYIKDEVPPRLELSKIAKIEAIGFDGFKLKEAALVADESYYARVDLPVHPRRDVAIIFKALNEKEADIVKMHAEDEKEWSAYLTARERVLIRELREKQRKGES